MAKNISKLTGDAGEEYAVNYLKKHGCKILARNFRKRYGELDIVAQKAEYVIFVEVKTRRLNTLAQPYEAVDRKKRQRLIKTALAYLTENNIDSFCRFDVCEVFTDADTLAVKSINYIEDAFDAQV